MQFRQGFVPGPVKNKFRGLFGCRLPLNRVELWDTAGVDLNSINQRARHAEPLSLAQLRRLSDEELMACLREGQSDALSVLFDRYQRLVLSIALKIVRDPAEAEDVTQTIFLDFYRAVAQFDPRKGNTKVWLMQYAYHRAINRRQHLQSRGFYKSVELEELETQPAEAHATFGLTSPETKELVRQSMDALSDTQRSVIEMACYEGLSMREIADRTGHSFVKVRHDYYRGLRRLRSLILGGGTGKLSSRGEECA